MSSSSHYSCKHLECNLIMHYFALFILIYCQLQLRLSLRAKGVPRDRSLSSDQQ
jgi:hypothetical protein